jgi:acyl dehydratase
MELKPFRLGPVNRLQIARFGCAVRDFNPIHFDDDFARGAGLPSVIAHGPLTATMVLDGIVAQVGLERLRAMEARFTAPVRPGDELEVAPTGDGVEVRNQEGQVVLVAKLRLTH